MVSVINFPSIVAVFDHGASIGNIVNFEAYFSKIKNSYSIFYDGPENMIEERFFRLAAGDYLDFNISGEIKIFCDIGKVSAAFDFYDKNFLWGDDDFGLEKLERIKGFVCDVFGERRVIYAPAEGSYPSSWIHELSNEDLPVCDIIRKIGKEWVVFNPSSDYDFFNNLDKIFCLGALE